MFLLIATLALIIESLVEVIKWVAEKEFNVWRAIALATGILITPLTGLDLFAAVGIPLTIPFIDPALGQVIGAFVGWVLTGVLICRGSGVVNNLLDAIGKLKEIVGGIAGLPKA